LPQGGVKEKTRANKGLVHLPSPGNLPPVSRIWRNNDAVGPATVSVDTHHGIKCIKNSKLRNNSGVKSKPITAGMPLPGIQRHIGVATEVTQRTG